MRDPLIGTCPMGLQEDSQLPDLALTSFVPTHCILKASAPQPRGSRGKGEELGPGVGWGRVEKALVTQAGA